MDSRLLPCLTVEPSPGFIGPSPSTRVECWNHLSNDGFLVKKTVIWCRVSFGRGNCKLVVRKYKGKRKLTFDGEKESNLNLIDNMGETG